MKLFGMKKNNIIWKQVVLIALISFGCLFSIFSFEKVYAALTTTKESGSLELVHDRYLNWGYRDENGTMVIPCIYEELSEFDKFGLAKGKKNGYYGFINELGVEVIPFEYKEDEIGEFSEDGLLLVKKDSSLNFINTYGMKMYDAVIQPVSDGVLIAKANGKYAFLNKEGIRLNDHIYDKVRKFDETCFWLRIGSKVGLADINGNEILPVEYDDILSGIKIDNSEEDTDKEPKYVYVIRKEDRFGLAGNHSGLIIDAEYKDFEIRNTLFYNDDTVAAYLQSTDTVVYADNMIKTSGGFILETNKDSKEISRNIYTDIGEKIFDNYSGDIIVDFKEIWHRDTDGNHTELKDFFLYNTENGGDLYGFIKKDGTVIEFPAYSKSDAYNGVVSLKKEDGESVYYTLDGDVINENQVEQYRTDYKRKHSEFSWSEYKDEFTGKYGFVDRDGNIIIPPQFEDADIFADDLAMVFINGNGKLINRKGQLVSSEQYENGYSFANPPGAYFIQSTNGNTCVIDKTGEILLEPVYEFVITGIDMLNFDMGKYLIVDDDEYYPDNNVCYHDLYGKPILVFDGWKSDVSDEGIITVKKDEKYYFYDTKGNMIKEFEYDDVTPVVNGFAKVKKDGNYGFVNADGIEVIPCIYKDAEFFDENGLARVSEYEYKSNGWFIINEKGVRITPDNFDCINNFSHGLAAVKKAFDSSEAWGYINMGGDLVISYMYKEGNDFNEHGTASVSTVKRPDIKKVINAKGKYVRDE